MGSNGDDRLSYRHSTPGAVGSGLHSSPGLSAGTGSPFLTPDSGPRSAGPSGVGTGASSADRLAEARARLLRDLA